MATAGIKFGEIDFTRIDGSESEPMRIRIERADPAVLADQAFLDHMLEYGPRWFERDGDVVRIHDDFGNAFTYVLCAQWPQLNAYEMRWPD